MSYLQSVSFKNFQSLKNAELDLDAGFNVIVGPSNLGKSASLRAIKALARNAPAPGLVRHGTTTFELTACFSNGDKIELHKGKNKSVFVVNGKEYAKSGVKAPDEVTAIWALPNIDGRELCFASQHETPFLLDEPASSVAKVLGDLTNANTLMEAVQKANRLRTEALNDVKARNREAEEVKEEILTHVGLSAREKAVERATELLRDAQALVTQVDMLTELLAERQQIISELETLDALPSVDMAAVDKAEALVDAVLTLSALIEEHTSLLHMHTSAALAVGCEEQNLEQIENEIHSLLEQSGVCPLCGSEIC